MDHGKAVTYLRLARGLPVAALVLAVGFLLAALGLPLLGVPLLAIGFVGWIAIVLSAGIVAVRRGGDRPWCGPRSVSEETNELLGWGRLEEAMVATGRSQGNIRRQLRGIIATAMAATLVGLAVSILRS